MNQTLSQQEINMLLREMTGESPYISEQDSALQHSVDEVVPYDLTRQERVVRGRMPTLELIHDRFCRLFRQTLSVHLRRPVSIWGRSTELVNFKDFLQTVSHPTSLNIFHMAPLRGAALMVMEQRLVYTLIDILFGGPGSLEMRMPNRDFTNIEVRVVTKVINSALKDLELAWKPVVPLRVKFVRAESNPQFVSIVPESDVVIVTTFDVELHQAPMTLSLCLPYAMLEPVRIKLNAGYQSEHLEVNQALVARLRENIMQSVVQLRVNLGNAKMPLRQFLKLAPGDHIPLDQDCEKPLEILVNNIPKFKGFQGAYKGQRAIKISELLYHPRLQNSWMELSANDAPSE